MVLKKVLIVDDEENIRVSLKGVLEDEGFYVQLAGNAKQAYERVREEEPDVIFLDIWMPEEDGISVLQKLKGQKVKSDIVIMSGHGNIETAVKTIKLGAFDFLEKPIHFDKVLLLLKHIFDLRSLKNENDYLREKLQQEDSLIGKSAPIRHLSRLIEITAPSNGWVLIQGENGTGKELAARSLHYGSPRSKERFVAVNCAAIPDELIESELFGHEKGAFTGAHERKIGKFELAHRGTLFLDEVGDMGLKMQAKILRVLTESCIQRLGSQDTIPIDIRLISATNKDLKNSIKKGEFREDLFYRLNVIPLRVPALRERKDDIPLLLEHFLRRYSHGRVKNVDPTTLSFLLNYPWPGNVRELKNWVERACILSQSNTLAFSEDELKELSLSFNIAEEASDKAEFEETNLKEARASFERQFILKMLTENSGNVSKTAQALGLERSHLYKKMKVYGIENYD